MQVIGNSKKKFFLVGFMGCGKSHNGKKLALALDIEYIDLDQLIEEEEGMTIHDIFQEKGETHFRKLEKKYLRTFKSKDNFILATGGGTACYSENMEWMNKNGTTIYLDASLNLLTERLLRKQAKRPLLKGFSKKELYNFIKKKLDGRRMFYEQANIRMYQRKGGLEVADRLVKLI